MRTRVFRELLLLLLLSVGWGAVSQESYPLVNHDTLWVSNCRGEAVSIGQSSSVISEALDSYFVLETNGVPFKVNVFMAQGNSANRVLLKLWDGDSASGSLLVSTDSLYINRLIEVNGGRLTGHLLRTDSSDMTFGISIQWAGNASFVSTCQYDVSNLHVSHLSHTTALLEWDCQVQYCQVSYGDQTVTAINGTCYLQNLVPDSEYTVRVLPVSDIARPCCARTLKFRTDCPPHVGCPNFTDLQSGSVRGYYGTFTNPYKSIGFVNYGSDNYLSRHSVHTDTTETDLLTGGQLRTVCPGTTSSVRLGNWDCEAEAEALEYFLYIDTNYYALLLLRYAIVLQNPGHSAYAQPRFRMEVLNDEGQVIDPLCGVADFTASSSLGWDSTSSCLWKDWTTLGFDMTPYQGQVVKVRFTTYDCSMGAHFGYAYFSAQCSLNSATTEYCGESDVNSITAPDGFNYLWYYDLNNPVSTEQTVYFSNSDSLLHCRLISKENPACYVMLNTYAGHRWPLAIIDTLQMVSLGCDGYRVYFLNRSVVTNDDGDTVDWHCESARWYFGDAFLSYEYSPQHVYHESGDYMVTLISGIANNSCTDTSQFTLTIPDFYVPYLKDTFSCDTFWIDGTAYPHDTIGPSYRVHHNDDCDTLYTLNLHILPVPVTEMPPDTFCFRDVYSWRGMTAGDPRLTDTAHHHLVDRLRAANGCDSLVVLPLLQLPPDRVTITSESDCFGKKYLLTAHSELPYLRWSSEPCDTNLVGHETDRSILIAPAVHTSYSVTTDYRDTLFCPTTLTATFAPVSFPKAEISLNQMIVTPDQPEIDAHDVSGRYSSRWWGLQLFPGRGDTIRLAETSPHLRYRIEDLDIDSVKVILAVSNGACSDTAHRTLPFVRVALWVPNIFTPQEEVNNRFAPVASGLLSAEMFLYDREGRLLFTTQDLQQGWDGTSDGHPCPQGTYVWFLRYRAADYPDVWQSTSGTVTLLR